MSDGPLSTPSSSLFSLRDRIALSVFTTAVIGAFAYGTVWSVGLNGGAFAGIVTFASLWAAILYFVWLIA